jgi:hypothetical protein
MHMFPFQSFPQRCSDLHQIEKMAYNAVTFVEKMGYVEGLAHGLQVDSESVGWGWGGVFCAYTDAFVLL